jgi:hypothetical protein
VIYDAHDIPSKQNRIRKRERRLNFKANQRKESSTIFLNYEKTIYDKGIL